MVSNAPARLGGNMHRGSGDIMVLVCNMTSQEHVTNRSSNIMVRAVQS